MRWVSRMTIVAVLVSCGIARAGSVLLASYETRTNGGGTPESDPRLEFILQLPADLPDTPQKHSFGLGLGSDVFWRDGDQGSFVFTPSNDGAFAGFASHASDGIGDYFMLSTRFPSGGGNGNLGTETELFGMAPDLVGYNLDFVRLIVQDISLTPWVPDPIDHPDIQGFLFETRLTYEFYGSPIPEPATLTLGLAGALMVSCGGFVGNNRCRKELR